jgi:diadenylate cyclase
MTEIFRQFSAWSALDVSLLAVIIYQILLLIRGTKTAQILIGVLVVLGVYVLSNVFPLTTVNWMMNKFYSSFIIILIIIFQDDIRYVLSSMGKRNIFVDQDTSDSMLIIDEIARAASSLAAKRIGALIVLERGLHLRRYIDAGVQLDARVSKEILMAIFHRSSPIHDGAVILRRGRIAAAGCFLPLTSDEKVDANLGTRHRAALGISEETDALVIIVSEEGASMALVDNGKITRKPDAKALREALARHLIRYDEDASMSRNLPVQLKKYYTQIFGRREK